jgi:hypothetical protein
MAERLTRAHDSGEPGNLHPSSHPLRQSLLIPATPPNPPHRFSPHTCATFLHCSSPKQSDEFLRTALVVLLQSPVGEILATPFLASKEGFETKDVTSQKLADPLDGSPARSSGELILARRFLQVWPNQPSHSSKRCLFAEVVSRSLRLEAQPSPPASLEKHARFLFPSIVDPFRREDAPAALLGRPSRLQGIGPSASPKPIL